MPSLITIADRLRYYRNERGLLQRDMAKLLGIERPTYTYWENDNRDLYPFDLLSRFAAALDVDTRDLMDEYHIFLYNGQAPQLKDSRMKTGVTQAEFANRLGVSYGTYKRWERGKHRIPRKHWARACPTE